MAGILTICVIAALGICLYFFVTAGKRLPEDGNWLLHSKFAHRGLHSADKPENTMAAFEAAVENGYGIELDVRLSSDQQLVVLHDNELERVFGRAGKASECRAETLCAMNVCGTEHTVPLFADVLNMVCGRVPLLIETKNEGMAGELEATLLRSLEGYGGKYAVQSFSPFSIGWFAKHAPHILRGQLSYDFEQDAERVSWIKRFAVKHLLVNCIGKPHFISYGRETARTLVVQRLRKAGLAVLAWTVCSEEEQAACDGCSDNIIFEEYLP